VFFSTVKETMTEHFESLVSELRGAELAQTPYMILLGGYIYVCSDKVGPLELTKYNELKTIAHALVYYSIKHDTVYQKMDDCCKAIRDKHSTMQEHFGKTVAQLMKMAAVEYLTTLHQLVQSVRTTKFNGTWPDNLLVLVCGPASPRFGHPAMQYFARLTNCPLEMRCDIDPSNGGCMAGPTDLDDLFPCRTGVPSQRALYYMENINSASEALHIGLSLLVEKKIFSKYVSMQTDILAPSAAAHLKSVCGR
jgi:hypothetical protein